MISETIPHDTLTYPTNSPETGISSLTTRLKASRDWPLAQAGAVRGRRCLVVPEETERVCVRVREIGMLWRDDMMANETSFLPLGSSTVIM